jgi:zinc protease
MGETSLRARLRASAGAIALALIGGAAALGGWTATAPAAYALPEPETFTLRNGMEVVVITDRRAPVVTHMVWYRVGSADEPRGASGVAHFLEHLMFKGTRRIEPGEFSRTIARNGGDDNAFTSYDYTAYYQRIARDRLELVMGMEADRMRNLRLLEEDVLSERDVIVEERRQRTDNSPGALLNERMRSILYPHHPYGTPVIGWLHEIQALDQDAAESFYREYYAPNNAILVVAGDIDAAELRPLAERIYGRIRPNPDLPERTWVADPPSIGPARVSHADEKVVQPGMARLYRTISYSTDEGRQAHSLDVAIDILGGGETSRLYRALVEEQGIAVGAGAYASLGGISGGLIGVSATPADGVTLEQLEAAVDAVIAQFLAEGPTEEEVARSRASLAAAAIYARDNQEQLANVFGSSLVEGESIEDIVNWERYVASVTRQEAWDMARQALDINNSVTGWLLPAPADEASSEDAQ